MDLAAQATEDKTKSEEVTAVAAPVNKPKPRGFAAMDPSRVSEIARKGGQAAHEAGTAHRFSADEARDAGRKGGLAPHKKRRRKA